MIITIDNTGILISGEKIGENMRALQSLHTVFVKNQ